MFTNGKKIAVLLSTYNGERYLREQLDSLLAQTCNDFHLYVRDDGSTDGTRKILEDYAGRFREMTVLPEDGKRLRAAGSFFYLLSQVDSDYYMFCDQDDVWLPEKIAVSLSRIEVAQSRKTCTAQFDNAPAQLNNAAPSSKVSVAQSNAALSSQQSRDIPLVAFSDLRVVDSNLHEIHPSFNAVNHADCFERCSDTLLVHNVVTGCAMIFNRAAKDVSFPVSPFAQMHDEWIALCAYLRGGHLLPISEATICYRQHSENTVGARQRGFLEKLGSSWWYRQLFSKAKMLHSAFGVPYYKFLILKFRFMRGLV